VTKREPFHLPEKDRRKFRVLEDEKSLFEPSPLRWLRRRQEKEGACSIDKFAKRLISETKLRDYKELRVAVDKAAEAGTQAVDAFRYIRQERVYIRNTSAALHTISALRNDPHFIRALRSGKEVFKQHQRRRAAEHISHLHGQLNSTPIDMLVREIEHVQENTANKNGSSGRSGHIYRNAVILSLTHCWLRWTGKFPAKKRTKSQKDPTLRSLFHEFAGAALIDLSVIKDIESQEDAISYSIRKALTELTSKRVRKRPKNRK
jgi:hypothetical protein